LYIDGAEWVDIKPGQMATAHLPPGEAVLSARPAPGLCPDSLVELMVRPESGKVKHFRVGHSGSMDIVLQPTAF
jgi:hypothetical protein